MTKINLNVELEADALVTEAVAALSSDQLIEYIIALDQLRAEWEVTEALRDYFVEEMVTLELEEAEAAEVLETATEPTSDAVGESEDQT